MSARVHHLPLATQARLRSSQILTSLSQVVSELVQNALDAGTGRVEVGVDCEEWSCWVQDDGSGMSKSDLTALVTVGRYSTSKAYTPASLEEVTTFGFRGEALASIADLCCLEISSRTQRSRECWSIISKGGKTLYNGPAIRWRRESPGTVVCVRDAFYNLPVRRRSHPSAQRTLELIRKELEAHALVFPQVSFSLENTNGASQSRPERGRVLAIPKTASTLQAFRHVFGRALVEHVEEIDEVGDSITVDGFISLEGAPSRAYQYLYINRHLLTPCELHRIIDTLFASSSFARHALDEYMQISLPLSTTRRSPKKSDRKPIYVLNITIPPQQIDNCLEPTKTAVQLQNSDAVTALLSSVIHSFLVKHGFKSDNIREEVRTGTPPRKRRKLEVSHSEESVALAPRRAAASSRARTVPPSGSRTQPPIIVPEDDPADALQESDGVFLWTDARTGETYAIDRRTGNSYPVNQQRDDVAGLGGRRTLASRPSFIEGSSSKDIAGGSGQRVGTEETETPLWIREALGANDAYMLRASQSAIPALSLASTFAQGVDEWHHQHGCARQGKSGGGGRKQMQSALGAHAHVARFTKAGLRGAAVLGQVDRKFVACVLQASEVEDETQGRGRRSREDGREEGEEQGEGKPTLVLIDQHAADERVRVERILRELCAAFAPPGPAESEGTSAGRVPARRVEVSVLLTRREAEQLAGSPGVREAFGLWGVTFGGAALEGILKARSGCGEAGGRREREREDSGYAQVTVESVPEAVANKLLEGDALRDLVKSYLAELAASGNAEAASRAASASGPGPGASASAWQRALRWCPRALLALANSRACRGAVMFNDALGRARCARLVRELAGAALPFQCAHGRPSLVPLARLGAEVGAGGGRGVACSRHLLPVDWARFGGEMLEGDGSLDMSE